MLRLPGGVPEAQKGPGALLLNHGLNDGMIVLSNHLRKRERRRENIFLEPKILKVSWVQKVFHGLRSQCATYWWNMLCFTGLLSKCSAWFSRKSAGFLKPTKDISNLNKPMRFLMMSICRHKAHQINWLQYVASVPSLNAPWLCLSAFWDLKTLHILYNTRNL